MGLRGPKDEDVITIDIEDDDVEVGEDVDISRLLLDYIEEEGPRTSPRIESVGIALGMQLQESVDRLGKVLTSVEGIQGTWGRVEAMKELRKIRSLLDAMEGIVRTGG